jgi:hypothetical protein
MCIQTLKTFEKMFGIQFTTEHNGKMSGMASLSTSPIVNTFCINRSKCKGSICEKCYARKMSKMYSNLDKMLIRNYEVLTKKIISVDEMPILNYMIFRFESFGDIQNEIQVINYFNLCEKNKGVQFTIWTKNYSIIKNLIENGYNGIKYNKPKNLIIIVSSPFINKSLDINDYEYADKVFTVYDKTYIKENNITINCGALNCLSCRKCYNKKDKNVYINEVIK